MLLLFIWQGLHAINLGDSGFMVVRDGCTIFRSPVQQHDFNLTYQLECGNSGDLPSSGQVSKSVSSVVSYFPRYSLLSYLLAWS